MFSFISLAFITKFFGGGILQGLLEISKVLLTVVVDFVKWFLKTFWDGLGIIMHNLSTLAVIVVVIIGSGWYFKTWDNDSVLKECIKTCPSPVPSKKYSHPIKKKVKQYIAPRRTKNNGRTKSRPAEFTPFKDIQGG